VVRGKAEKAVVSPRGEAKSVVRAGRLKQGPAVRAGRLVVAPGGEAGLSGERYGVGGGMAYHPPGHFGDSRTVSFAVDRFA
jgi:hypothetical protein